MKIIGHRNSIFKNIHCRESCYISSWSGIGQKRFEKPLSPFLFLKNSL